MESSPLISQNEKTYYVSHTSSLGDEVSKLNTEETKRSDDLSDHETHQSPSGIDRYEFYSKYASQKKLLQSKLSGHIVELEEKYKLLHFVAQGASGSIFCVEDIESVEEEFRHVAIKKIEKPFEHKMYARKILRELKILRLLKHENLVEIKEIMLPKSRKEFNEIYIITELMDSDLHSVLNSSSELAPDVIKFFLYQIVRGLKFIHSANLIHRDLKPKNLLVNSNCQLKICDFGSAKTVFPELKLISNRFTDYVVTRWYRAPELLLSWKKYTAAVDIWSVGCIFAEMLKRRPLFKGSETFDQIQIIIDFIGTPEEEDIECIPNERTKSLIKKLAKKIPKSFEREFPEADPEAIDLLKKLLTFNPDKRITAEEALNHPYLSDFHDVQDEPMSGTISSGEFEYETEYLSKEQFKDLIYEECLLYHFPEFKTNYLQKIFRHQSTLSHIKVLQSDEIKSYNHFESGGESSEEEVD